MQGDNHSFTAISIATINYQTLFISPSPALCQVSKLSWLLQEKKWEKPVHWINIGKGKMKLLIQEAATANKQSHEVRYHNIPSFALFY